MKILVVIAALTWCWAATAQDVAMAPDTKDAEIYAKLLTRKSEPFRQAVINYLNRTQEKIINGKDALPGRFPWQVSLGVAINPDPFYSHFCGGSLIAPNWVVTAAHCVHGLLAEDISVTVGAITLAEQSEKHLVQGVFVIPQYDPVRVWHDVALLQLATPALVRSNVQPITMADDLQGEQIWKKKTTIVGWGATQRDGTRLRTLQYLDFPLVARNVCNRTLGYAGQVTDDMLCAGFTEGGAGSCKGDSGGGLTGGAGPAARLLGVYSWGQGCALPNKVGVYGRIVTHRTWLDQCMNKPNECPVWQ